MLTETRYEHSVLGDEHPTLAGTTMKVKELIAERLAWGWSAEELLINHPDLTLGKVYSALAYSDHQDELDRDIESRSNEIEQLKSVIPRVPPAERLKRRTS